MNLSFLVIGAKYTRPELAERWGYSSHHAIGKGVVTPQGENVITLFVTRIKQEALTQYEDALSGDLLFWEGQEKHGTDDRVVDAQNCTLRNFLTNATGRFQMRSLPDFTE